MRPQEADWIGQTLHAHVLPELAGLQPPAVALNLGSGTRQAREQGKPYVQKLTIEPLLHGGVTVLHSDLLEGDGIDLSGDLFDPAFAARLAERQPRLVFFCNVVEHLPRALLGRLPAALDSIVAPGGLLLITAPWSYPYHADPIDTMFRPSVRDIAAMFPGYTVVTSDLIDTGSYRQEFMAGSLGKRLRKVLRLLFPFVRPKRWLSHAHRFLWLTRPYQESCVLLRKPVAAAGQAVQAGSPSSASTSV